MRWTSQRKNNQYNLVGDKLHVYIMTLELLQFIRDNIIHLQVHQYQIIQVIEQMRISTLEQSSWT